MRRIDCETCTGRGPGTLCEWTPAALTEFRHVGSSSVYRPRQVIFAEGNPSLGLHILCRGAVKLYCSDRLGRDHILEVAGAGAVLGELPLDGDHELSVSAEALVESQLTFLPRERLVPFLERYPDTAVRLIGKLSRDLAQTRRRVRDLALKDATSRLADLLIRLADTAGSGENGRTVALSYRRREIAEMIGVSTETAIRLLTRLKQKGVIDSKRRSLIIVDPERLQRIASYPTA